jgi:ABC-type polysaccharide/polyol phosphate export permease
MKNKASNAMSTHDETLAATGLDLSTNSPTREADEVIYEPIVQSRMALLDIKDGLRKWPIALMLAYQDIKLRYRRSVLGPFWLTLSMAITVYTMGYIYSHIFHTDMASYFPYLTGGMLGWTLIASMVTDFTDGLVLSENLIKQVKLPYTLYIHRIACRNMIIYFHNLVVLIPILIIYHETTKVNLNTLLLLPGLFLVYVNACSYGLILGMLGARFRDISQIIKSLVQVVFFITPVMWKPDALLEKNRYIVELNPFYSYIELIRAPLLGSVPSLYNIIFVLIMTGIGLMAAWIIFMRRRARIVYWL